MKILGLIPARGGSKGIPHKNSKILGAKPLIAYTIQAGLDTQKITELIVSTDDLAIAQISKKWGASTPFIRPAELATDTAPTINTVIHAVQFFQKHEKHFEAVCLLQPTSPFRTSQTIDAAIEKFVQTGADSLVSVREIPHQYNPHWAFEENEEGFLEISTGEKEIITRRQALPKAYHRDGSIYLVKTSVLLGKQSLYGDKIAYFINNQNPAINIDTPSDWAKAEDFLKTSAHDY